MLDGIVDIDRCGLDGTYYLCSNWGSGDGVVDGRSDGDIGGNSNSGGGGDAAALCWCVVLARAC